jgi:hypothetical protein
MRLIANRQLTGEYGTVIAGQEFECSDQIAHELLAQGMVRKADPPKVVYETKVVRPAEVGPTQPFRNVPVPDQEPAPVDPPRDRVVQIADLQGTAHAPGRRRR